MPLSAIFQLYHGGQFYFGGFMLFYALWFDWLSIFPVSVFNSM
jgi:hypothetical protein